MKKLLALLLAVVMVCSLVACGTSDTEEPSSSASTGNDAADTAEDANGSDTAENAATDSETEADTSAEADAAGEADAESDMAYVQNKGTLVVGITNFAPMDYQEGDSDEWIGFDADMAKLFAEYLGVDVEFIEINWDYKIMELDGKSIDCVWNGMTLTDEVTSAMSTSVPYCLNAQVLVVPADKASDFEGLTSLEGLNVAVESGSAGEDAALALGATTVPVQAQSNTLFEVSSGTSDAAVIDLLMAGAMIGEGTSYADLTYTLNLNEAQGLESEEYGVGFRQGSDLTDAFNTFWAEKVADGTVLEVATTYGLQESVILD